MLRLSETGPEPSHPRRSISSPSHTPHRRAATGREISRPRTIAISWRWQSETYPRTWAIFLKQCHCPLALRQYSLSVSRSGGSAIAAEYTQTITKSLIQPGAGGQLVEAVPLAPFRGILVLSHARASRNRLGYARYVPCRLSKSHNVDIGLAPRVVKGFISDVRVHQFGFPFTNRVQYRFPLGMSIHLQLEHPRRNRVTEPVTRASCKPHFHIPTWSVRVPPASHFITVERAST